MGGRRVRRGVVDRSGFIRLLGCDSVKAKRCLKRLGSVGRVSGLVGCVQTAKATAVRIRQGEETRLVRYIDIGTTRRRTSAHQSGRIGIVREPNRMPELIGDHVTEHVRPGERIASSTTRSRGSSGTEMTVKAGTPWNAPALLHGNPNAAT